MPQDALLDPQGKTVHNALESMEIDNISCVTIGKYIEMTFGKIKIEQAKILCEEACTKLLANHNTESYHYEIMED